MSPFTAFKIISSVELHFGSLKYSMLKYGISTKQICTKFANLTPGQKYKYEWFSTKFPSNQDVLYAAIACVFKEISPQFAPKEEILEAQLKFKGRREAMTYFLKGDHSKFSCKEDQSSKSVFFSYLGSEINPEYVILRDFKEPFLENFYNDLSMTWASSKILKLIKYKDFFNHTNYIHLLNGDQ